MPRPLRRLLAPLTVGPAHRRYVHLLPGAVIVLPAVALVAVIVSTVTDCGLDLGSRPGCPARRRR